MPGRSRVLAATPGPVVAALIARSATGGVRAAVPLAAGVAVGDVIWPLLAMLGIGVVAGVWASFLLVLRYVGAAILVLMGVQLIRAGRGGGAGGRRRRPRPRERLGGVLGRADGDRGQPEGDPVLHGRAAGVLRLPQADAARTWR